MGSLPQVFYSKGVFLIYNEEHVMKLRGHRIIGQLIGCAPKNPHQIVTSGLPYLINHYAAGVVFMNKLADFKELKLKKEVSSQEREAQCLEQLSRFRDEARLEFEEKRTIELRKRNIELSPSRVKEFDDKKLRLTIQSQPDNECSSFQAVSMEPSHLFIFTDHKMIVFKDLYDRGFYVSLGMKFGSDFLVYLGDPVRYHAQYAVRLVASIDGKVDLAKENYSEINALNRLCHTAKKTSLLATVDQDSHCVNYFTLKDREYLSPDSSNLNFEPFDPKLYPV